MVNQLHMLICLSLAFVAEAQTSYKIAFGSCSHQDSAQILWDDVLARDPDVWIWLGDNIYGDSEDPVVLRDKYNSQKSNPQYKVLSSRSQILGLWDDHDYGVNDGGKEFVSKAASQREMLDFLDAPESDPRRTRNGIYVASSHTIDGLTVKIILLDVRFHRDPLTRRKGKYKPNRRGSILGDAQWDWLQSQLDSTRADILIVGSGIQILPEEHRFEKWANFPRERKRLLHALARCAAPTVLLLSGDRHIAEISKIVWRKKSIWEVTSSSLTHAWNKPRDEPNRLRIGPIVVKENFGLITIVQSSGMAQVNVKIYGDGNQVYVDHQLKN